MLAVVFCMLLTWPSCSTTRHTMRCLYGRCRYGPRLSKRSNGMIVGCVGGEASGEIGGLRGAWQQSGRAGIMRRAGVEAWTWWRGRGGVDMDAGGRRPLPQSLRLVRDADSGLGSRRLMFDRVLAALGDSARGRPRSTRLRSDSAKASSARGATLARRTGVRVPRRLRSRSPEFPVLASGARTAGGRGGVLSPQSAVRLCSGSRHDHHAARGL